METFNLSAWADTRAQWAERFYTAAEQSGRLFRNDGVGFTHISAGGPTKILTVDEFFGVAHTVVEIQRSTQDKEGNWKDKPALLSRDEARILFTHDAARALPLLRAVVRDPVVIRRKDGTSKLIRPGYEPSAGLYYYVAPMEVPIEPLEGTKHLEECFSGVPFERPEYRSNLFSWLLGAVVYDPLMDSPFLVVSGNQQNIGKSVTVQAGGYIITGAQLQPVEYKGEEFGKQLTSKLRVEEKVIFLDNIVTPAGRSYDNPQLSALLSQGFSKQVRILGHSRMISASGILFAASLNDAKLSADLATRSLLVKLYKEASSPMQPYVKEYALQHRRELYGELLGLALRPAPAPSCAGYETFRFRRWLDFVQPRIEPSFGSLAIREVQNLDDRTQELFSFGADLLEEGREEFTSEDVVKTVSFKAEAYSAIAEDLRSCSSDRGKKSKIGRLLNSRVDTVFQVEKDLRLILLKIAEGDKTGAKFSFRKV